ncbi:MAG TPA: TetR/AcrR family transcriptional regulator C-terminal domain-containing protein [Allosphingosinicella sp.]|nr:TetR/AcrR family transcriptional regulator C-terminal domain-containing protein [Allosphingosinicella sp.]
MREIGAEAAARLLRAAFRLLTEPGAERPGLAAIAGAAGVAPALAVHWYEDVETLGRLAATASIRTLAAPFAAPPPALPLRASVRRHALACAALFGSDDYRRLVTLVMREGPGWPWLAALHERGIAEPARERLARIVRQAGIRGGGRLEIRSSGTRAFVERLQAEFALRPLLPPRRAPARREARLLVERSVDEALAAIYSPQSVALALGAMMPAGIRPRDGLSRGAAHG